MKTALLIRFFHPLLLGAAMSVCPLAANAAPRENNAGKDLQNRDFTDENFNGANFEGANLRYSKLNNTTCKNANFRGANLDHTAFRKALLDGADFTGANLKGAIFTDATAWHANFRKTEIHLARAAPVDTRAIEKSTGLDLSATESLIRAGDDARSGTLSFHYSDLSECTILGNADRVDFREADLRGANLSGTVNLDKALLKGAKYDGKTTWNIDPARVGAVPVAGGNPAAVPEPDAANSPFVGKWGILKGEGDALDNGSLKIFANHSYEWQPSLSADPPTILSGKWEANGERIVLRNGELGETWVASRVMRGKEAELNLKSQTNKQRVAVTGGN